MHLRNLSFTRTLVVAALLLLSVALNVPVHAHAQTDVLAQREGVFGDADQEGVQGGADREGVEGGAEREGVGGVQNPLAFESIQEFFAEVLEFLVMLATPFIVFMLIYTGFKFVMAQGKPEDLQTARKMFLWTIIGGMLILGASIIAGVIKGTVDDITWLNGATFEAAVNLYNLP